MPSVPWLSPSQISVADVGAGVPCAEAAGLGDALAHLLHQNAEVPAAGVAVAGGALNDDLGLGQVLRLPAGANPQRVQFGGEGAHFLTDQVFHNRVLLFSLYLCTLYAKKEITSAARKPVKPTSVSMMVQVLRVVFSSRPTSDLTSQKPESLKWDRTVEPPAMAAVTQAR